MLALKDNCLNPETQKPYLKSVIGGKDNSVEGIQVLLPVSCVLENETVLIGRRVASRMHS